MQNENKNLTIEQQILNKIFDVTSNPIIVTDKDGNILSINEAFSRKTGYSKEELIGKNPRIMKSDHHDKSFYEDFWFTIRNYGYWEGEIWDRKKSGEVYTKWITVNAIYNENGEITHYIGIFVDISKIKENQENLARLAYYDSLTKLPNRELFIERLQQSMLTTLISNKKIALLFIDINRFKNINDTFGHHVGDEMLFQLAQRFQKVIKPSDTFARLGADKFAIILNDLQNEAYCGKIASKLIHLLIKPFTFQNQDINLSVSIGITICPTDSNSLDDLLKNADLTMFVAKERGSNQYLYYDKNINEETKLRMSLEIELHEALEKNEFQLMFQPIVDIKKKKIVKYESLIRWHSETYGNIPPYKFISILEESGLIIDVGRWIIREACSFLKEMNENVDPDLIVSVNISAIQFHDKEFVKSIKQIVDEVKCIVNNIELEITESIIMKSADYNINIINDLREIGFRISIDDFGTGYSSLSYLKKFGLDVLKIDKSFIDDINNNINDEIIVRTIINLAHNLNLLVVAEGVEEIKQLEKLTLLDCDEIQGYYFSKPISRDDAKSFKIGI